MDKNKLSLTIALVATFLITNGTFIVLCEKDIILEYINKVGDWSNAILFQGSKAFLYYAAADTFYNIRYLAPKFAYAFAPIKWADKINGWLGGNVIGELEHQLAQQTYHPLYKDTANGLYSNVVLPLYNNIYAPLVGIKPKKELNNVYVPEPIIFEVQKEKTILINKVHVIEKHDEDLLALRDEIHKSRVALDNITMSQQLDVGDAEIIREINSLSRFEEAVTYTTAKLNRTFMDHYMFLADEDRGAELAPCKLRYLEFHKSLNCVKIYFDHPNQLFINVAFDKFQLDNPVISKVILDIITPVTGTREEISSDGVWRLINMSSWAYIDMQYNTVKQSWYRTSYNLVPENCGLKVYGGSIPFNDFSRITGRSNESGLLLDKIRTYLMGTIERDQSNFDTQLTTMEAAFTNYLQRNNPQDDNISVSSRIFDDYEDEPVIIDGSIASETIQWLPAASIGALTTLTVGQALVVFSYFFGIEAFQTMVYANLNVQDALVSLYTANNMEIPVLISDSINNSPQSASAQNFFDLSSPSSSNGSGTDVSTFRYFGYGLAILGTLGLTWYLTKYGMDASPVVETAKTFKESLQDKYVNFK